MYVDFYFDLHERGYLFETKIVESYDKEGLSTAMNEAKNNPIFGDVG